MRVAVAAISDVVPHQADHPRTRAAESVAARSLLRRLLADLGDIRIATRSSGQPYLPDHPDLAISLSHDGGYVAAAASRSPGVGVDVQLPVPASLGLLKRCGVPDLAELPERDLEFAWVWTVQEACVKATGQGLAGKPWSIPVQRGQSIGRWHGVRWRRLRSPVPASVAFLEAR